MPLYEFQCCECGKTFELLRRIKEPTKMWSAQSATRQRSAPILHIRDRRMWCVHSRGFT